MNELKHALRQLVSRPGSSASVIVMVALGIGASAAVFAVLSSVLLEPLAYPESDRIMNIYRFEGTVSYAAVAPPDFTDVRDALRGTAIVAGNVLTTLALGGEQGARRVLAAAVTDGFFDVFGLAPRLGRWLDDSDQSGRRNGVVISSRLWREELGGRDDAIGATLRLNGDAWTIVGVAPSTMDYPLGHDVWMPLRIEQITLGRGSNFVHLTARLRGGASRAQAQGELDALAVRLAADFPKEHNGLALKAMGLQERLVARVHDSLWMLMIAVSLLVAIVCANVANLLLGRMIARERDLATRSALGATPARLARAALIEAGLLVVLGAAAGSLLAMLGVDALVALRPPGLPRLEAIGVDARVIAYVLVATLATTALCAALPAWQALRRDPASVLHGARSGADPGRARLHRVLVAAQLALSMALLVGVGTLLTTLQRLGRVDAGFDTDRLLTAMIALPAPTPASSDAETLRAQIERNAPFLRALEERLGAIPGVASAGVIDALPLSGTNNFNGSIRVPGVAFEPGAEPTVEFRWVTPGYWTAAGIPLLRGELPPAGDPRDRPESRSILVNSKLATLLWPGEDAVGRAVEAFGGTFTVGGVVGDVRQWSLDREPSPELYFSYAAVSAPSTAAIVLRAGVDPAALIEPLRTAVAEVDPTVPVFDVRTMDEVSSAANARRVFALELLGVFAAFATLIAAIGLYSVMTYAAERRTREVGVKMALGADRRRVLRAFVGEGMSVALLGIGIGALAALAFSRLLRGLVVGAGAADVLIYLATALLLAGIALGAVFVPARRASGVNPIDALRAE